MGLINVSVSLKGGYLFTFTWSCKGEKNWKSFCLKSWTRNTQSDLVSKIGKNDHLLYLLCFLFYFDLFLHGNVLYDFIFIFKPFIAIYINHKSPLMHLSNHFIHICIHMIL